MNTEDLESYTAFVRLEFPPAERDIAHRLAVAFAEVVERDIVRLRPEHTLVEILGWRGADSLDTIEFVLELKQERRFNIADDFAGSCSGKTFRELVRHIANRTLAA